MKKMSPDIWIIAEQQSGKIQPVSYELLTRGLALKAKRQSTLTSIVIGQNFTDNELSGLILRGADRVIAVEAPDLEHFNIESHSAILLRLISEYSPEIIIAGATTSGRSLMPYTAMKVHAGLTADCTELDIDQTDGSLLQTRPAIGGNIMATIRCPKCRPQMATVRPKSTCPAPLLTEQAPEIQSRIIRHTPFPEDIVSRITRTGFVPAEEQINLSEADKIVVVGRGIKKAENIDIIRELANSLGAALGATREVVDRGWLSYPHQIGLSGKTVSPKLYIGIGVSGAIQHLAGMQTSSTIIAINSDPEAQIFKIANFGIIGNLFDIIPILTDQIKNGDGNDFI